MPPLSWSFRVVGVVGLLGLGGLPAQAVAVCATTADLGAVARAVGGDRFAVTTFAPAVADPHFVDPRPGMVRDLHGAALCLETGRDLEVGWLPVLVEKARNPALAERQARFVAGDHVRVLGAPAAGTDRRHGDVHGGGNPHFLLDPLAGLQVGKALAEQAAARWPATAATFRAGYADFARRLAVAAVGEVVAKRYDYDAERLLLALPDGSLGKVLEQHGDLADLGGFVKDLLPLRGTKVVAEHDLWPYFAERCGIRVVGFCEPLPGIPPTTAHLTELVATMQAQDARVILSVPYFAPQHAERIARHTGAVVAAMAHQPGARPGTDDYVAFVDYNVRTLVAACRASRVAAK